MHQISDKDVESALAAFSKGNHPSHATLEERMKAALQSIVYSIEQGAIRRALIAGTITKEDIVKGAPTAQQIADGATTYEKLLKGVARLQRALLAAKQFYYGPMGLLYSVNNCYHTVAVEDLAAAMCRFHNDEKDRK